MSTSKLTSAVLSSLLVLGASLPAFAGAKHKYPVSVNTTSRIARGAVGSARNSTDSTQFIGCVTVGSQNGRYGNCYARDSAGTYLTCYASTSTSSGSGMVQAMASVSSDSYIVFAADSSGRCTTVTVCNYSWFEPKAP